MDRLNELFQALQHDPAMMQQMMAAGSPEAFLANLQSSLPATARQDKDNSSNDELAKQLKQMNELYETIKNRKGKKPPNIPDMQLIYSHRMMREQMAYRSSRDKNNLINTHIFDIYHSKATDLSSLNRIFIQDFLMETWHEGRYPLCRTIEEPCRMNAIISVVEDETGRIAILSLYNFTRKYTENPDFVLPKNTILAIKEPYFKGTSNGGATIRCDTPTDVIFINYMDENYKKLKIASIRDWGSICASVDRVHSAPTPKTLMDWKTRGNDLYKKGFHKDALRAYTLGLSLTDQIKNPQDQECANLLLLNRSAVYFTMGRFDDALKDSLGVLEQTPENTKAMSRVARSYYQLRSFKLAAEYFGKLVELDPSFEKDAKHCLERVKEETTGDYDWNSLFAAADSSGTKAVRFDVADYINSEAIEVRHISKVKGRGVFAKRDIAPGTLLVLDKAFSVSFANENEETKIIQFHMKTKSMNDSSKVRVITDAMHRILECPSLGESVYQLWSGDPDSLEESGNLAHQEKERIVDFDRIHRICNYNAFSCGEAANVNKETLTDLMTESRPEVKQNESIAELQLKCGSGLWIKSSFFNHSCLPSTSYAIIGDLMIIRSNRNIKAGEEITVCYIAGEHRPAQRRKMFQGYGFRCKCNLCEMDAGVEFRRLDDLNQYFAKSLAPRIKKGDLRIIPTLMKHVEDMKKAYSRSKFLFEIADPMGGLALLLKMQGKARQSVQIYEQIWNYFSNIKDVNAYLEGRQSVSGKTQSFYFAPNMILIALQLICAYRELNDKEKSNLWVKMLIKLEEFNGLGPAAIRKKHVSVFQAKN